MLAIYELSQVMPETNVDVVGSTKQRAPFLDPKTMYGAPYLIAVVILKVTSNLITMRLSLRPFIKTPLPTTSGAFYRCPVDSSIHCLSKELNAGASTSNWTDDPNKKARRPYTITKSWESWTDPDHDKFLEALQL
ncbi:unnamed protein product [Fraxinus pennsylvanica]|uniref:Uncharacterized protein n=1 Tax=Fraxinus pennsylvanica TaxID=56036 RepID=A0AAD2A4A0_9LAMI|nr:unnamed protein product [Fraxinus pennsylvanica]